MLKALITDYEYDSIDLEREMFAKAGIELAEGQRRTSEQLIPAVRDADGVIVQYAEITRGVIAAMERCRVIVKYGIGINNIDADAATEKGIFVCNVPDYGVDEVSNHAIALMLALARKLYRTDRDLRRGIWDYKRLVPISRFEGSSVGIVGFGRMGQAVARKLGAFGVRLQAFDPYFNEKAGAELQVARTDLDTLIRTSDYITLHCPATAENNGLFGEEAFAKMKPTACLINTTRGTVVAQGALVRALREGRIAAAGIDVYETEPLPKDDPLLALDNVILSPHSAWYSEAAIRNVHIGAAAEVIRVLQGDRPRNLCNKKVLDR